MNINYPVAVIRLLYTIFCLGILLSCKQRKGEENQYDVRSDIRFGSKFYSLHLSESGKAYVVKGVGSPHTEELKVVSSDTSNVFNLDSAKVFYNYLNNMKENPIIGTNRLGAPRVEIYYNKKKIYDAYKWDETFWDLFRPLMLQIPKGFNPFLAEDQPF